MDNAMIVQRTDALKAKRSNIEAKWNEIDRYIMPLQQGNFAATIPAENSKNWSTLDVWDSTAPIGADRLAAMLHSTLLSGRWFGASFRAAKVNQDTKARSWLDDCIDRMHDAIMVSNFPVEMASLILEWVGYGNGCLTQGLISEKTWEGLDFQCRPVRELLFEQDHTGRPYRSFFPLMWTPTQIISKFRDPEDKTKPSKNIPESIIEMAKQTDGGERQSVIFCIYPREDVVALSYGEKVRAPLNRPWAWKYILRQGLVTLEEGGHYEMTTYVGRWARSATSQWGYGPSLLALPTVKLVNALQEHIVNAAAKVVDPATLVTERGLMSDLDLGPGGQTTVRRIEDIAPYESKARFDVSEMLLADHRNMIRKHFREDDITLKDSPAMTATEVNRRFVLLNRFLAPPVKRIQFDIFAPVIQNTFNAMYRMDQLEEPPDIVKRLAPRMQIEFFGPLMTAQRDDEVAAIERLLAAKAAMTKMDPNSRSKHVVKDDVALREMAERLATPASLMASMQEVDAAVEQEQKIQQAAAQAQIRKTQAEGERAMAGAKEMMGNGA